MDRERSMSSGGIDAADKAHWKPPQSASESDAILTAIHVHITFGNDAREKTGSIKETFPMGQLLWIILVIIVALWVIGLVAHIAGSFIHLLLVAALVILLYNLITGRQRT